MDLKNSSGYQKSISNGNEYKATKQLGESVLFLVIGNSYIFFTLVMMWIPKSRIPYLVIIVGTVLIVILYYMRIFGIPILGTDIIIRDLSTDWRDVITKICQQILVIPVTALLILRGRHL